MTNLVFYHYDKRLVYDIKGEQNGKTYKADPEGFRRKISRKHWLGENSVWTSNYATTKHNQNSGVRRHPIRARETGKRIQRVQSSMLDSVTGKTSR